MEVVWTGLSNAKSKDKKLMGNTSIWMFPIYGSAVALKPISKLVKRKHVIVRGSVYTACIYAMEYASGMALKKNKCCPWDYSKSKYHVNGLIRLDYAPVWFTVGLIYEKLLDGSKIRDTILK